MVNYLEILKCFPQPIAVLLDKFLKQDETIADCLEEIRFRNHRPIILKIGQAETLIDYIVKPEDILETLQHICENSIYAYQNQICNRIYYNKRGT